MLRYRVQEMTAVSAGVAGVLANVTLGPTLYAWMRRSEFTADRAGLLACRDGQAAQRAMTKLAGVPMRFLHELSGDSLLVQAEAYANEGESSWFRRLLEIKDNLALTHPYWVLRAVELQQWIEDGFYEDIIDATPADLARMAKHASADSMVQALISSVTRATAHWAVDRFDCPYTQAGRLIRRMVYAGEPPQDSPLAGIQRLELHVQKLGPTEIRAMVEAMFIEDGALRGSSIPVPFHEDWEQQPAMIREEFIRRGVPRIVRELYTVPALADSKPQS
jgi:hypothetical protein